APALALPYELVSQTFLSCLLLSGCVRPHSNRVPMALSQICSQWRGVALTTPQLWTSISLHFGDDLSAYDGISPLLGEDAEPIEDHTANLLDLWFNRAAGHPLSISL
ncbi:hypothetical protein DFH06DRAFT_958640, partial [Mycena polygramma]